MSNEEEREKAKISNATHRHTYTHTRRSIQYTLYTSLYTWWGATQGGALDTSPGLYKKFSGVHVHSDGFALQDVEEELLHWTSNSGRCTDGTYGEYRVCMYIGCLEVCSVYMFGAYMVYMLV